MNNKTVLMAAVLAIATVLATGLTILPSSVQDAQANPCATEQEVSNNEGENGPVSDESEDKCRIIGYDIEFKEGETSDSDIAATETEGAAATAGNSIIDDPLLDPVE
jgi:hypothetical protein